MKENKKKKKKKKKKRGGGGGGGVNIKEITKYKELLECGTV